MSCDSHVTVSYRPPPLYWPVEKEEEADHRKHFTVVPTSTVHDDSRCVYMYIHVYVAMYIVHVYMYCICVYVHCTCTCTCRVGIQYFLNNSSCFLAFTIFKTLHVCYW